jgi:hypothetical protein
MAGTVRSPEELRNARRRLFESFPSGDVIDDTAQYQVALVREIKSTEHELRSDGFAAHRGHLRLLRLYGDALAHAHLSTYALRQLARNPGKPPHLSGQGKSFDLVVDCLMAVSERGVPAIIADLTNILKNGDLIVCGDPNLPAILECKASKVRDARFERQGRRGRQLARFESIVSFLREGRGRIWGESVERTTVEIETVPQHDYRHVADVVASALEHRPLTVLMSERELVSAALMGENADTAPLQAWARNLRAPVIVAATADRIAEPLPDVAPPILWDLPAEHRWALMEGDISVTHALAVDAFVNFEQEGTRVLGLVDIPGVRPHGYEVRVGPDLLTIGPRFLLDVLQNYETISSAAARLVEGAAKARTLLDVSNREHPLRGSGDIVNTRPSGTTPR